MFKSSLLQELEFCGFVKDVSKPEKLDALLSNNKITVYGGFDLTAKSLHVGNLMQIMLLKKFLKYGHRVIFLLGGATTKIGDPSGKDDTRRVLTDEEIAENTKCIMQNFAQFVNLKNPDVLIVNNAEWLQKINYVDFLRDVGRHFTVNRMLAMESVKQRLEKQNPMNFVEFNYMLMQGYDFAYLNKHYNCILQVGGSDQWGNITEGMELCSRMNGSEAFALTSPLITRADGVKMGKSLNGAVSLNPAITSSLDYFQYFRNMPDDDISKMLKIYTELEPSKINELAELKGKEINEAKKILAFEALKLRENEEIAISVLKEAEGIFAENSLPTTLVLNVKIGEELLDALVSNKVIKSKSEGKTLILGGGIKINEKAIDGFSFTFQEKGEVKLSVGKKKHYKIIIS
jgi:tyrosyl-tRNA synthetase